MEHAADKKKFKATLLEPQRKLEMIFVIDLLCYRPLLHIANRFLKSFNTKRILKIEKMFFEKGESTCQ
jgi:hypothetical protein